MGLTLAQIDRLLTDWQQKGDAANQNLLDLYDLSAYQRLSGVGNPPSNVTGTTQQQASTALTAIERLFEYLELFNQHIDRARKLRRELPSLFINDSQLQAIEHLLVEESIELPNIQIPLAQRDLVGANQLKRAISVDELIERMTIAFIIARDTFVTLEAAWTELEFKLIDTNRSIADLERLAQELQLAPLPELANVRSKFQELQQQIDRDPLAVNLAFGCNLMPLINHVRQELETLAHQRQLLQADFAAAPQLLAQLTQLNRDSIAAEAESQTKIRHDLPMSVPLPAEELTELERWLARLVVKFESGLILPVRVGLNNWLAKVRAYTQLSESALVANRLPLDTRQELRGRLDALTAKAVAKSKVEDSLLTDLGAQAKQVLYASPTDLTLAIELVREYDRRLQQLLAC
ncbi:hypothetical protein [Chamaesiphon sp. VAR_69_metabat_338]|uniref:hypothetical protein n=1 Tax=Chamaesiphon sp. VAR_69_metabat_338 TaxID=2964704 RepID=UPI00286E33B6|nr:hypothetical protein [Chamaesiphon sp. VAR_69_metabat_338]